ncbi:MAG: hypothetical protein AB7H97_22805, partial [Pseudobdellovibrionaceae bacterium]
MVEFSKSIMDVPQDMVSFGQTPPPEAFASSILHRVFGGERTNDAVNLPDPDPQTKDEPRTIDATEILTRLETR